MKNFLTITMAAVALLSMGCRANEATNQHVWIVNGGSLVQKLNPLPFTTEGGEYLTLEGALYQKGFDFVSNSAIAGSATFDYTACFPSPAGEVCFDFDGYEKQFQTGLGKVIHPVTGLVTAKYGLIAIGNNCLSSLPHGEFSTYPLTSQCETADFNAMIDTEVSVGNSLCALGITAVYDEYPSYGDMDVSGFIPFGATWVLDEAGWNEMSSLRTARVLAEVSCAIVIPTWEDYTTIGDLVHADADTQRKGGKKMKNGIQDHLDL